MIEVLKIICGTIVLCYLIRYICIWNCQSAEYKLYSAKSGKDSPLVIRPHYHRTPATGPAYWGYIVYDSKKNEPFTGEGANTYYAIFRELKEAEDRLRELNKLYGY